MYGEQGGLYQHYRGPQQRTAELAEFDASIAEAIPAMWAAFTTWAPAAGAPNVGARHRLHAARGILGRCMTRLVGSRAEGPCDCAETFNLYVEDSIARVRTRFAKQPHFRPPGGRSSAAYLVYVFRMNDNPLRAQAKYRGAPVNLRDLPKNDTVAALPTPLLRSLYLELARAAASFHSWKGEDALHVYLARRLAELHPEAGESAESLLPRLPAMIDVVEQTANRVNTRTYEVPEHPGTEVPWFEARIRMPLLRIHRDADVVLGERDDDEPRGAVAVATEETPDEVVERSILAATIGALAVGRLDAERLAEIARERSPWMAVAVAGHVVAVDEGREAEEALRVSLGRAVVLGALAEVTAARLLEDAAAFGRLLWHVEELAEESI